jgi:hypothetical protein
MIFRVRTAYKGRNIDVKQVSRELGVRYLLEGSVRRCAVEIQDHLASGSLSPVQQINGEEPAASWNECATIVGHEVG